MKKRLNQNKLEYVVAIGFGLLIFILSSTDIGYIPISPQHSLDMGIIPAIFAAMIGGYRVGIPVAIAWAGCAYFNNGSNLQIYTLYGLIINRVVLVMVVYSTYRACKKIHDGSPYNVYRALVTGITAKSIVANLILAYILKFKIHSFDTHTWLLYAGQQYVLELALCILAMAFLINHLRQVHILNGIKRKQKSKGQ